MDDRRFKKVGMLKMLIFIKELNEIKIKICWIQYKNLLQFIGDLSKVVLVEVGG